MNYLSDATLANRLKKVYAAQKADKARFKPNAKGDGYLTRNERWSQIIKTLEREFILRCMTAGVQQVAEKVTPRNRDDANNPY